MSLPIHLAIMPLLSLLPSSAAFGHHYHARRRTSHESCQYKAFGGQVVTYDRYSESRGDIGAAIAKEQGATLIPPFEYLPVIAGQGTRLKLPIV